MGFNSVLIQMLSLGYCNSFKSIGALVSADWKWPQVNASGDDADPSARHVVLNPSAEQSGGQYGGASSKAPSFWKATRSSVHMAAFGQVLHL